MPKPTALQQRDRLALTGEVVRRQQPDYSAADNHHLLLLSHHLIQPINRERRARRPRFKYAHPCPQQTLGDISGPAPGLPRIPVLVKLNAAHASFAMTESAAGVASRSKS